MGRMITAAFLRHLDTLGLCVHGRAGADAFLEELPAAPVNAIAAFARPGGGATAGGHGYDEPGFQILVRDDGTRGRTRGGYEKAVAIRNALHGLAMTTIAKGTPDEVYVVQCLATTSQPINIGDDSNNRPRWSIEFEAEVRNVTPLRG